MKLLEVKKLLDKKANKNSEVTARLPLLWKSVESGEIKRETKTEFFVNPHRYLSEVIKKQYLTKGDKSIDYSQSLQKINKEVLNNGDWIKQSVIYSALIRSSSAYDMDGSGYLEERNSDGLKETGTFLRMLLVLPYLKELGVNVLYLLPVSKYSTENKKGDFGSPYAVADFTALDENLGDPLVNDSFSIDEQFCMLVEAAHILDIRVIIDIIPRTNSVNSDMVGSHPDWFYWIEEADLVGYKPPHAKGIKTNSVADAKHFAKLFASEEVKNHLLKFRDDPKTKDPALWQTIKEKMAADPDLNLSREIADSYGLIVAPAFSDCINDTQPAWSDVTYLRLYLDHPQNSKKHLKFAKDIKPYVLYDVAKASLNPGKVINEELWRHLAGIIPHYQNKYGIDGARIDMGHALPNELIAMIVDEARKLDGNFAFVAEELQSKRAKAAKKQGYNCIVGDGFINLVRIKGGKARNFIHNSKNSILPQLAVVETHDTPRVAARRNGLKLAYYSAVLNYFIANTIPFINSAQELLELQPMNTGLDCRKNERFSLNKDDPYYGKLALFDRYQFHYDNDYHKLFSLMKQAAGIRKEYQKEITKANNVRLLPLVPKSALGLAIAYKLSKGYLLIIANQDLKKNKELKINIEKLKIGKYKPTLQVLLQFKKNQKSACELTDRYLNLTMLAGEVKIIKMDLN